MSVCRQHGQQFDWKEKIEKTNGFCLLTLLECLFMYRFCHSRPCWILRRICCPANQYSYRATAVSRPRHRFCCFWPASLYVPCTTATGRDSLSVQS